MLRRSAGHSGSLLAPYLRTVGPLLPLVGILGVLSSLLEGAGVALLIPLLSVFLAESPAALPGPLHSLASIFGGYGPQSRAILIGAAIFGLILLKDIVLAANESLLGSIQARVGHDIRVRMADSLLGVDYPFFLEQDAARLTSVTGTDSWFVAQVSQSSLALIPAVAGLLVLGALLAILSIKLFLIVIVGAALIQGMIRFFEVKQRQLSLDATASNRLLWQRLLTLLQAPRVIRLFGQEDRERRQASAAIDGVRRTVRAANILNSLVHPSVDALVSLLFLTILIAGYWSGMTVPEITAFLLLLTRAQPHAKTVARARLGLASFDASLREVDWLTSQGGSCAAPERAEPVGQLSDPISFEDVSFSYPSGAIALEGVTLIFEPGAATALIGKSGSGKTTLVNLLCRLIEPQTGEIRAGPVPISSFRLADWRKRIAVAGQDMELVSGTVAENIAYGRPEASDSEIEAFARAAGADHFIAALPQGFDTVVGPQGLNLSGGQRQRIGLARALLRNPDLLILDEAVSAVDALSDGEITQLAKQRRYFRSVLIISHRKTAIAACDRGIVLQNGKVVEAGPLGQLAYYQAMAGEQSGDRE